MRDKLHGSSYVSFCSYLYGIRWDDCKYTLQRLFRAVASGLAVRNWYSHFLHGISLGATCSRRSLESSFASPRNSWTSFGVLTLTVWACALSIPNNVSAGVLDSQLVATSSGSYATSQNYSMTIGTGLTGTVNYVILTLSSSTSSTISGVSINCFTSSAYNTLCGTSSNGVSSSTVQTNQSMNTTPRTYVFNMRNATNQVNNFSFDSTKYYVQEERFIQT